LQKFDHNIGFEKNANFFAENWQKSPKIMIITSTPGQSAIAAAESFADFELLT
jgi:hypothetical protein